jgi:hypothetical protein
MTVSSDPSGVADPLQTFSGSGASATSSTLASSKIQAALSDASAGDIVELSGQAVELQQVSDLFASYQSPTDVSNSTISLLA